MEKSRCNCKRNAAALAEQAVDKKNQLISMHWLMNIYDWLIMVYGQKTNHLMQP